MLISRVLLGCYIVGALQAPVLEVLHVIAHVVLDQGHGDFHMFADHAEHEGHLALDLMQSHDDDHDSHERTIKSTPEKIGMLFTQLVSLILSTEMHAVSMNTAGTYVGVILDTPSPPPKSGN